MPMEVVVLPHDPAWIDAFRLESPLVLAALGENAVAVHHIGSTAIRDTVAKPVIDILTEVLDIDRVDAYSIAMERLGYQPMGE